MSLSLKQGTVPNNLYVKTDSPMVTGCKLPGGEVQIGDYTISMEDFCEVVYYVLTNTNLDSNKDPRLVLVAAIKKMKKVKGHKGFLPKKKNKSRRLAISK